MNLINNFTRKTKKINKKRKKIMKELYIIVNRRNRRKMLKNENEDVYLSTVEGVDRFFVHFHDVRST